MSEPIHQLYCTHCTYGTSRLHQNTGAIKNQSFEYSTRAGSVKREESHDFFRKIEPHMSYRLPSDIPAEQILTHNAKSVPQRLAYFPSIGGLRVVTQVSYRDKDTQGRPGSYFAHVLFSEVGNGPLEWSAADCLKLWGCPQWRDADAGPEQFDFELPTLSSLDEFRRSPDALINESVLIGFLNDEPPAQTAANGGSPAQSFLTESEARNGPPPLPGGAWAAERSEPASVSSGSPDAPSRQKFVVPERWKRIPAADRRQILIDTLQGFLELDFKRHQSVLLGIEPEMAALLFFGVASLLPKTGIAERLSFSTFESNQDRPGTALAATCCHNREQTELPSEAYQSRGFGINTFKEYKDKNHSYPWRSGPQPKQYARVMVELLVAKGDDAVRELTARFEQVGAVDSADLEALIQAHQLFASLDDRDGQTNLAAELKQLAGGKSQRYFREACAARYGDKSAVPDDPTRIAEVLKQLCDDGGDEPSDEMGRAIQNLVQCLLDKQADQQFADLINGPEAEPRHQASMLAAYLERYQRVPPGCEKTVWHNEPLLQQLLKDRPDETLAPLLDKFLESNDTKPEQKTTVFRALMKGRFAKPEQRGLIWWYIDHSKSSHMLRSFFSDASLRSQVFDAYPYDEPGRPLREYLRQMFQELQNSKNVQQLGKSLEILRSSHKALPGEDFQKQIRAWSNVQKCFDELGKLEPPAGLKRFWDSSGNFQRQQQELVEQLAKAAAAALPEEVLRPPPAKRARDGKKVPHDPDQADSGAKWLSDQRRDILIRLAKNGCERAVAPLNEYYHADRAGDAGRSVRAGTKGGGFPLRGLLTLALVVALGIVAFAVVAKHFGFGQPSVLQELQALEEPAQIERFHAVVGDNERFASLLDDADKDGVKTLVRSLSAELAADEVREVSPENQAKWLSLLPDDEAATFWLMLSPEVRKQHLLDFDESRLVVVLNACKDAAIDSLLAELDADEKERLSVRLKDAPGLSADTQKRLHALIGPPKTPTVNKPAPVAKEKSTVPAVDETRERVASFLKMTPEQILEFNIQDLSKPLLTSLAMEIPNGGKWDAFVSKLDPEQIVHVLQVLSENGLQNKISELAPVRFERLSPKNLAAAARVIKAETLAVLLPKLNDGQLAALPDDALSELDSAQLHALLDKFAAERLQIVFAKLGAESWHRLDEKLRSRLKDKLGLDDYQELARNYGPRWEEPEILAPRTKEAIVDDDSGTVSYQELPPPPSQRDEHPLWSMLDFRIPVKDLNLRGWNDLNPHLPKHVQDAHPGSTLWVSNEIGEGGLKTLVVFFGNRKNPRDSVSLCRFWTSEPDKVQFRWEFSDDSSIQEVQNSLKWCVLEARLRDGRYQAVALRMPTDHELTLTQGFVALPPAFFPGTQQNGYWFDVFGGLIVSQSGTLKPNGQPDIISFGDKTNSKTFLTAHSTPKLKKPPANSVTLVIEPTAIRLVTDPPLNELAKQIPDQPDDSVLKFYRDAETVMDPKNIKGLNLRNLKPNEIESKLKEKIQEKDEKYRDVCKQLGRTPLKLPPLYKGPQESNSEEEKKYIEDYTAVFSEVQKKRQEFDHTKTERDRIEKQIDALRKVLSREMKLSTVLYRVVDGKFENDKWVDGIAVRALISK